MASRALAIPDLSFAVSVCVIFFSISLLVARSLILNGLWFFLVHFVGLTSVEEGAWVF